MDSQKGKCAIVTATGSSVGSRIAYQLLDNSMPMYVSAVTTPCDDITGLCSKFDKANRRGYLHIVQCNAHSDDDIQALFSAIQDRCPMVLLNNISFATESFSTLTDNDTTRWQQLIDTKIKTMITYARKTIDNMKLNNMVDGYIFNIINIVGSQSLCEAWKYAVMSLSNNLRKELSKSDSDIKATTITAEMYTRETIMETPICEFVRHKAMMPSDIAKSIIHALKVDDSIQSQEILIKGIFPVPIQLKL